jgi:hypothetical protein
VVIEMGKVKERGFSVEMDSKNHVRSLVVSDESRGKVLIEGNLGELRELEMVEEIVLQMKGTKGTLRVDLDNRDIRKLLEKKEREENI